MSNWPLSDLVVEHDVVGPEVPMTQGEHLVGVLAHVLVEHAHGGAVEEGLALGDVLLDRLLLLLARHLVGVVLQHLDRRLLGHILQLLVEEGRDALLRVVSILKKKAKHDIYLKLKACRSFRFLL